MKATLLQSTKRIDLVNLPKDVRALIVSYIGAFSVSIVFVASIYYGQ